MRSRPAHGSGRRLTPDDDGMPMQERETLRVECHSGYRGEERPTRFWLGERAVAVVDVLDRWLGPNHRYFKVRGDDEGIYILRHDDDGGRWELTLYDSGRRDETRLSST